MIEVPGNTEETFSFAIPVESVIVKADPKDKGEEGKRYIQGIASTEDKDLQGEKVVQSGIDYSYFLKYGYLNDDHKPGVENKIGEPTECRITPAGFWLKGFLYKNQPRSEYWWEFINALNESGATRKVCFSIQGKVIRRQGNKILRCWIQDVAITASPVNTSTWAEIAKSLSAQKWCKHPWKSLEKACKDCRGNCAVHDHEEEEKALTAGGMGRGLIPQSLEGSSKLVSTTYKSNEISYQDAINEIILKGYTAETARAMADAIFANSGLI